MGFKNFDIKINPETLNFVSSYKTESVISVLVSFLKGDNEYIVKYLINYFVGPTIESMNQTLTNSINILIKASYPESVTRTLVSGIKIQINTLLMEPPKIYGRKKKKLKFCLDGSIR